MASVSEAVASLILMPVTGPAWHAPWRWAAVVASAV
jgi:hypothetical protein